MAITNAKLRQLRWAMLEIDAMRRELKRRTMIYQYDDKCRVAAYYKLDPQTLFDMPYTEWAELRARYFKEVR
jgi:hypothetical protein